ncbi:alkaline phosphatase family protein [Aliifodinibius sp. S!AR15-10]|uniref:sulfatase-like hydrolase/transferase n=1 Tax=Aliifodinibius sp. S!AR15-10 TaxID=2950437 RepID=UPI00285F0604|nr:sulfatase-like hydrolase/transferase [Aliifodinibius sp. S!AR15-10]MDR8391980.1 alkaline phosphatase family protein [Aliifodinibius sp. S!AR15-10]
MKMNKYLAVLAFLLFLTLLHFDDNRLYAQDNGGEQDKVILITLDGLRWQELFTGADPNLIANKSYVSDSTSLKEKFWRDNPEARRKALMPFIWNRVAEMGTIHGNRTLGSKVNLTNNMVFSYPGYNEILTGRADDERIDSNDKMNNPNITILEELNNMSEYKGKVAAFGSWDVFPYIINEERSGVPVNAGFESARGDNLTRIERFLNKEQPRTPSPWGSVRLDMFTHNYALEYMKRKHPDIVYIAYGETDDFAHDGDYQAYLNSAHSTDSFLRELWNYTQEDPYYKDQTTFIITTDHGRGTQPLYTWRSHGTDIEGAEQVWLIMYGAQIEPEGEVKRQEQLYSPEVVEIIKSITF